MGADRVCGTYTEHLLSIEAARRLPGMLPSFQPPACPTSFGEGWPSRARRITKRSHHQLLTGSTLGARLALARPALGGTGGEHGAMAQFEIISEFMYFRALDAYDEAGVLTLGWRITDRWDDPWTARFNAFKSRDARAIRAAKAVIATALQRITFGNEPLGMVAGAISSSKEQLEPADPVWQLGAAAAEALRAPFRPEVLRKQTHKSLHNLSGAAARAAEVNGKYIATGVGDPKTVLVVDDFVTRGNTLADIARAIAANATGPVKVYGLALGKTERASWMQDISNDHVPARLAQIWDQVQ